MGDTALCKYYKYKRKYKGEYKCKCQYIIFEGSTLFPFVTSEGIKKKTISNFQPWRGGEVSDFTKLHA